ncbi:MAG: HEAT repeat domain-containing protein [Acidobacteriia bacterium]|nr:HEAT repeat domain-containing protein [Terriglobia bacterium]
MKLTYTLILTCPALLMAQPDPAQLAEMDAALTKVTAAIQEGLTSKMAMLAQLDSKQKEAIDKQVLKKTREAMDHARLKTEGGREESHYRRGISALDEREWDRAAESFTEVSKFKGTRTEGALYWRAYALRKLGRREEALATLDQLQKSHPGSRWLNDAKVLDQEVRQSSGQTVTPEQESDEELKLYALNSLVHTDPDRALPLLEKILSSASSPQLKEKALFVLAQMPPSKSSPGATQKILVRLAQGNTNPDLQRKAVLYLGEAADKDKAILQTLSEIYASSDDAAIKRNVLHGYARGKDKDRLLAVATTDSNKSLRRDALHMLVGAGGAEELWKLYGTSSDRDTKAEVIRALSSSRNAGRLVELARKEPDAELKKQLVRELSHMKSKEASDYLVELISK